MPDSAQLTRVSPLLNPEQPLVDVEGLKLVARQNTTSVQVLAFKNQHAATAEALTKALGIEASTTPGVCNSKDNTQVVWNGPNQWMVISEGDGADALLETVQNAVGEKAAVVDQSHGRVGLRISGEHARYIMQKNCALDLHPRSFGPGSAAQTMVAHVGALVIQVDDQPAYDMFVNRSFARSFAHSVAHSCAEFSH